MKHFNTAMKYASDFVTDSHFYPSPIFDEKLGSLSLELILRGLTRVGTRLVRKY